MDVENYVIGEGSTTGEEFPTSQSSVGGSAIHREPPIHPSKLELDAQVALLHANLAQWKQRHPAKRQSITWGLFQATGADKYSVEPQLYRYFVGVCGNILL